MIVTQAATVGMRIRGAREAQHATQSDIAKVLGMSRAAVAQWELDTTSPSVQRLVDVAKILETTPQWLAYGLDNKPQIVREAPPGQYRIPEVTFGDSPTETTDVGAVYLPADYLREMHCNAPDKLILYRVEGGNMAPAYEYGDKVIVDTLQRRPSPSGVFLHWDGVGPAINTILVTPVDGVAMARVLSKDAKTEGYTVEIEKLAIIGRVRGVLKVV